jgi:hypothetical protein
MRRSFMALFLSLLGLLIRPSAARATLGGPTEIEVIGRPEEGGYTVDAPTLLCRGASARAGDH